MGIEFGEDERDKKIRGGQWDPLAVKNKDPNYHYRWLRKEKLNMAKKTDYLGYEVVGGSGDEKSVLNESTPIKKGADASGQIEVGDVVLARIPKELHEHYRKQNLDKIKSRTQGIAASFKNATNNAAGAQVAYEEHADNPNMVDKSERK